MTIVVFTTASMMLEGCVNYMGIQSKKKIAKPSQFSTQKSIPQQHGRWPSADWAKQFGDPQLVALIQEGIENNPSLEAARARVAQTQAIAEGKGTLLLPHIGTQDTVMKERFSKHIYYPPPFGGTWFTQPQLLMQANYELDIWGKNIASLRQAISEEKVSEASLQQAKLILVSTIASTYIQLAFYCSQEDILARMVNQRDALDKLSLIRLKTGLDPQIPMQQAKNQLATARSQLEQVRGTIQLTKQQLSALLGQGPDRGLTIKRPQLRYAKTPRLPNHLPIQLLGRRPDIVGARWQVEASMQGVKNAKAQFYPDINLMALAGVTSFQFNNLFTKASTSYQITPAISLPIFDAGALRSNLRQQYGRYEETVANYNNTVINALTDVASQITNIKALDQQMSKELIALKAAKKSYDLALTQYRTGLNTKIVALQSELNYLAEQSTRLQLMMNRYTSEIALYKALGGGFVEEKYDYSMWKNTKII